MMRIRKADRLRLMLVTLPFLLTFAACDGGELATPMLTATPTGETVADAARRDVATPTPTVTPTPTPEPLYDIEEARAELAAARDIWESKGSEDYTIEYFAWLGTSGVPLRLTVRNGVIESAEFLEGRDAGMPVPPDYMIDVLTIDGLFDKIEATLSRIRPHVSWEYDAEFGYPRNFEVTYSITVADSYFEAGICCYTPLAPHR